MAGVAARSGDVRTGAFWRDQLAHQAPMLIAMILMVTVLRSTLGLLAIAAGLWVVALVRARAARTMVSAREFLVDVLAMALILVVPLLHGGGSVSAMPGMAPMSLGGRTTGAILLLAWVVVRCVLLRSVARDRRAGSVVSAGCCALGLVAMLVI